MWPFMPLLSPLLQGRMDRSGLWSLPDLHWVGAKTNYLYKTIVQNLQPLCMSTWLLCKSTHEHYADSHAKPITYNGACWWCAFGEHNGFHVAFSISFYYPYKTEWRGPMGLPDLNLGRCRGPRPNISIRHSAESRPPLCNPYDHSFNPHEH
jgi:hypothetical protein